MTLRRLKPGPSDQIIITDDEPAQDRSVRTSLEGHFFLLAALAFLLVFAGLFTMHSGLIALALPLLVYMGAVLYYRPPAMQLSARRTATSEIAAPNTPVTVTLTVTNQGRALDEVFIQEKLPAGLELVEGKLSLLVSLPEKAQAELRYTVKAVRGGFIFPDLAVRANEYMGITSLAAQLPARLKIVFMPETTRVRHIAIRPARTHGHFGPIPSRKTGSGVDFYGLREYQMGDPRRWINWRASARHNQQMFVNQFEQERIADVGIILDARAQSNVVLRSGAALFEYAVQAAGSLSEALLNDGNRVGLLIYGFGMERVFPGYGKVQQERILYALGQARTGKNFALENMGYLPTRFFPAGSQIVMISPLINSDVPAFTQLRACGYEVLLVSPDPVDFEARDLGVVDDLPHQIARVERAIALRKLQRMGVRVLDWKVDRPFEPLVRAQLSRAQTGPRPGGIMR